MTTIQFRQRLAVQVAIAFTAITLSGCEGDVVDYRNTQIVNGKVYAGDANTPFSGKVTNVPYDVIFNQQPGMDRMISVLETGRGLDLYQTICNTTVKDGELNGDVVCKAPASDTVRLNASFDAAALSGDMKIYSTDGKIVIVTSSFKQGQPDGKEEQVLPASQKTIRVVHWDMGTLDGESKAWDPQTGELIAEAHYRKGVLNGDFYTSTISNGQQPLIVKGVFHDGKFTGTKPTTYPNDQYIYDIRTDVHYVDDVIQNQNDIDRMNQFGRQVADCVHQSAYPIAETKGRTYLTNDEKADLVRQCKAQASTGSNASNNASSILAAASGEDKNASAYLDSINKNQKENRDEWPSEDNACTQQWQKDFVAKNGPDAIIRYDMAWEWVDNCRAGKQP
ncbi:toxin-antitoxin system YwqK family antitoxin [Burkholderia anthina]|uniref:toxin-antitoxin system YwqK family antitoxin n=1 Tax=Burkholderia anthina TaxID=179879 RepID=UPI00075580AA|nr:hypothetical protein [Burkholderia anthina]KVN53091.1 hypothetical protein WT13_31890 [Burkholderia anthina]